MTRSQIIFLGLVFGVIFAIYLVVSNYTDSYKILPLDPNPEQEVPNFEEWHTFNASKGNFTIMMPTLPTTASEKLLDPKTQEWRKYDMYVSEQPNGTIYMISLITFEKELSSDQKTVLLTSIVADMVSSSAEHKLLASNENNFRNQKALDFVIENNEVIIDGKTFIKDQTLFLLTRISKKENQNLEEFKFFTNSFDFLEDKP